MTIEEIISKALKDGAWGGPTEAGGQIDEMPDDQTWHVSCHDCEAIDFNAAARIVTQALRAEGIIP